MSKKYFRAFGYSILELMKENIPYIKLCWKDRDIGCDKSITEDCFTIIAGQKMTRLLMPMREFVKNLRLNGMNDEKMVKITATIDMLSKIISNINELVRIVERYNKLILYNDITISQTEIKKIEEMVMRNMA